jgi:hypothetical protein
MKTTARHLIATLVFAIVMFFALLVEGQVTKVTTVTNANCTLQFGSVEAVETQAFRLIQLYGIAVDQDISSDDPIFFNNIICVKTASLDSKEKLNKWFQTELQKGLKNILTSTNSNRQGKYEAFADAWNLETGYSSFGYYKEFNLLCTNGQYCLPDMSNETMELNTRTPYIVTGIRRDIMEIWDSKTEKLIKIIDSDNDYDPWFGGVDETNQVLLLQTEYIIGKPDYKVKLAIIAGENYRLYDGSGNQIPETPVVTSYSIKNGTMTINVKGGDPGRHLILIGSTDMVNWTNLASHAVGYDDGTEHGFTFSESVATPYKFYKVIKGVVVRQGHWSEPSNDI